mmetsp:Transcript_4971/g.13384  ORF Transcript_4971/g.13384 Transcript_4971/m.13384 type:complete len:234 (+) Transcript_4971:2675-3376(+)
MRHVTSSCSESYFRPVRRRKAGRRLVQLHAQNQRIRQRRITRPYCTATRGVCGHHSANVAVDDAHNDTCRLGRVSGLHVNIGVVHKRGTCDLLPSQLPACIGYLQRYSPPTQHRFGHPARPRNRRDVCGQHFVVAPYSAVHKIVISPEFAHLARFAHVPLDALCGTPHIELQMPGAHETTDAQQSMGDALDVNALDTMTALHYLSRALCRVAENNWMRVAAFAMPGMRVLSRA